MILIYNKIIKNKLIINPISIIINQISKIKNISPSINKYTQIKKFINSLHNHISNSKKSVILSNKIIKSKTNKNHLSIPTILKNNIYLYHKLNSNKEPNLFHLKYNKISTSNHNLNPKINKKLKVNHHLIGKSFFNNLKPQLTLQINHKQIYLQLIMPIY